MGVPQGNVLFIIFLMNSMQVSMNSHTIINNNKKRSFL
jgi:hypothetical protein